MNNQFLKKLLSLSLTACVLSACGTRDYETTEEREEIERAEEIQARREIQQKIRRPIEEAQAAEREAEETADTAENTPVYADTPVTYGQLQFLDARLNRYYALRGILASTVVGSLVATLFAIYQRSQPQKPFFKQGEWRPVLTKELAYSAACAAALSVIAYQLFIPPQSSIELLSTSTSDTTAFTTQFTQSAREVAEPPVRGLGEGSEEESRPPGPTPWQDE